MTNHQAISQWEDEMGRVKDYYHDEICDRASRDAGEEQEPDDLELLQMDAEAAANRLKTAIEEKTNERCR